MPNLRRLWSSSLVVCAFTSIVSAQTTPQIPDACTFITRPELEKLVGRELREGEKRSQMPPGSQCSFRTPPEAYVKRTFENVVLPPASQFDMITVTTFATTVATFKESREFMGKGSPNVPGIGDEAFMSGPAMVFVRVGARGFSIRVYVNAPETDAGRTRLREAMLSLARAGAAKMKPGPSPRP